MGGLHSEPKIYKDQLVAARDLLKRHEPVDPVLITTQAERPGMTATRLQSYLEAAQAPFFGNGSRNRYQNPSKRWI